MTLPKPIKINVERYIGGLSQLKKIDNPIKLSANESALGPSPKAITAFEKDKDKIFKYPESDSTTLRDIISKKFNIDHKRIICGAGSDQIFDLTCKLFLEPGDEVIVTEFGFIMHRIYASFCQAKIVLAKERNFKASVDEILKKVTSKTKIVFVANPNNPTGTYLSKNEMLNLREIKKANKKYASIERYVKETSRKIFRNGERKKYKGVAVNIFKNNVRAVVYIGNKKEGGSGTGSIISRNGEIITNWHVVGNARKLHVWLLPDDPEIMTDDKILWTKPNFIGTVINRNKGKDLALVKIEGLPKDIKVIRFGKTSNIPIGSTVYAIGHPKGEAWTFSSGMVTQIRPNYKWSYCLHKKAGVCKENSSHSADIIQHEVPTNPGNSGGPLLDEKGLMVGVNSFVRTNTQLLNFSVAIEEVEAFLKEEIKEDKSEYIKKK